MNAHVFLDLPEFLPDVLIRASLAMLVTAAGILLILKWTRMRSPTVHRIAWMAVLIQGCILTRVACEIPWYEPVGPTAQTANDSGATLGVGDSLNQIGLSDTESDSRSTTGGWQESVATVPGIDSGRVTGVVGEPAVSGVNWALANDVWWNPQTWSTWNQFAQPGRVLTGIWITGILVLLAAYTTGYVSLLYSLRRTTESRAEWQRQWRRIMCRAGVAHDIPLQVHESLGPFLCLTPSGYRVVVPRELWEELPCGQRAAVLRHELGHYWRGDVWKSFSARLIALPHWFNPVAWLAVRKFDECGEWACDRYLMDQDPARGAEFARALLRVVQFPKRPGIGLSGAGGAAMSERLRRLCGISLMEDSLMKRTTSLLVLAAVFSGGLAEFKLVSRAIAQEPETVDSEPAVLPQRFQTDQERMRAFAERISGSSDDPLIANFVQAIHAPPGQTALLERASILENRARETARENALPGFLNEHFELIDEQLVLKPDSESFRSTVLADNADYQADVDELAEALAELASRMGEKSDADKMLKRLLENPLAAWVLYATEVRQRIRPDERTILDLYQRVFVESPSGDILIRPGMRAQVESQIAQGARRRQALERVRDELLAMSQEISDFDETHRTLKQMFADNYFAAFASYDSFGRSDDPERGIENLFKYLDSIFEDHADGLRLNEQGIASQQQRLQNFDERKQSARRLREPVARFAARIPAGYDDLHDQVKEAFGSDIVLAMLTSTGGLRANTGARYVEVTIGPQLTEGEDGLLHVRQPQEESVIGFCKRSLQTMRNLRRRFASVDDQVRRIADEQLRGILESPAGRYMMIRSINQRVAGQQFDGLGMWIDQHFSQSGDGWVLNEESRPEITQLMEQVRSIEVELKKDDF